MTFSRPKVGPRVYLSCGPSGHAETFKRIVADHQLELYLSLNHVTVQIAVDGFIRQVVLEHVLEDWGVVVKYLADMTKLDPDLVPLDVAVAFWAQVDQARAAAKGVRHESLIAATAN